MSSCSTITVYSQDNERPSTSNRSFGECGSRSQFAREIEKWSGLPRTSTPIKNPSCNTSIRLNSRSCRRTRDSPQLALAQPKLSLTAIRSHLSSFRPISRTDQWVEDVKKLNRYDKTEYLELLQGSNGSNASIQMLLKNQRPDLDDEGEPIGQEIIKERLNVRHQLRKSNLLDKNMGTNPQEKDGKISTSPQKRPASILLETLQNKNGTNESIQKLLKRKRANVDSEGELDDTKRTRISNDPLLPRSDSSSPEICTNVRGCMERNMGMLLRQQQQRQDDSEKRTIQEKQSTSSGANYFTSLVRTKPKTSENSLLPQIRNLSKIARPHHDKSGSKESMQKILHSAVGPERGDGTKRRSCALSLKSCSGINESMQHLLRQQRPDVDSEGETIDEKNKNRSTEKSLVFKTPESMKHIGANQSVQEILKKQRPDLDSEGEPIRDRRSVSSSLSPQLQIVPNKVFPDSLKPLHSQTGTKETTGRLFEPQQNVFAVGGGTIRKRKSVSSSPTKYTGINHNLQQLVRQQRPDVDSEGETVEERRTASTAFKIRFKPGCSEPTRAWQDNFGTNASVQKLMKEQRQDIDSEGESIDRIHGKRNTTSKQGSPKTRLSRVDYERRTIQTKINKSDTFLPQIDIGINESVQQLLRRQRPDVDSEGETIDEGKNRSTKTSLDISKSPSSTKNIVANQSVQDVLRQQRPDLDSEGETIREERSVSSSLSPQLRIISNKMIPDSVKMHGSAEADGTRGRLLKKQRYDTASGRGSIPKRKSVSSSPHKFTGINHIVQELLRQQRPHLDSEGETAEERKTRSPTLKILFIQDCPEDEIETNEGVQKLSKELRPDVDSKSESVDSSRTRTTDPLLMISESNSFIPLEKFRGCSATNMLEKEHATGVSEAPRKQSWPSPFIAKSPKPISKSPKLLEELMMVTMSPLKMQETIWRQRRNIELRVESIGDRSISKSYQNLQPSPRRIAHFNSSVQDSPKQKRPIGDKRLSFSSTDSLPHRKSQSESSYDSKRLKLSKVSATPLTSKQSIPEDTSSTSMLNDSFGSNMSSEPCSAFEERYAFGPRGRIVYITVQWINPGKGRVRCRIETWTETEFCDGEFFFFVLVSLLCREAESQ
ncbi:hypothetical protein B9Z55_024957 [Caenorhabditis nigoni]|uniref:Uncharacterized protein n=1 Tax=Caenorhabditis nigoni TaxID=1611254 RepID=A0A2G5SW88_9PELO|nr:hypothetical protein B9Z55_024957 [Caenorhabditis nigoni]